MIVWPGLRRSVSAISRLFNGASFSAPLTHSAIPTRAASGTTATFTRATTATVRDNEGVLRTAIAGEARFEGARRVSNLIPSSESFAAGWAAPGAASVSADAMLSPIGTLTADALIEDGTTAFHRINHVSVTRTSGQVIAVSVYAKYAGRNLFMNWNAFCNATGAFNLQTGEVTQGAGVASIEALDGGWYRCTVIGTCTATGADNGYLQLTPTNVSGSYAGDGVSGVYIWGAQLEDITGRADQATPSEYVSVGVASSPYYHGSMVDGVKCFPTDLSGNPIPAATMLGYQAEGARTNVLLHSNDLSNAAWSKPGPLAIAQNEIGVDGAISAWTLTDDNVGVDENVNQASVKTAATWTDSCYFKKTTGAQATYPVFYAFDGATRVALCTVDTTNGVATVWTAYTGLTVQPSVARCRSFNDDKWFVELSFAATAATWTTTVDAAGTTNATQSTGTLNTALTGSCVVERLQSELGSFASSYIATTTAAVTRNADVLTYSGADVPNLKTLMATFRREVGVSDLGGSVVVSDGTINNYAGMYLASAPVEQFSGVVGGAIQWNQSASNAYVPGATSISATSFATNDIKMAFDGVGQTPDTVATVPTGSQLNVGHIAGAFQLNGTVGGIYGWTSNKSQSELNAVTTP